MLSAKLSCPRSEVRRGHHLAWDSSYSAPFGTRQAGNRMLKSGEEQMLHGRCTLSPSLQGSGDDDVPVVWKTFLVILSLALKHQAPVGLGLRRDGRESNPLVLHMKGKTKAQKPLEKPLSIPDLSDRICALGPGL